jgi:hypothetical protein
MALASMMFFWLLKLLLIESSAFAFTVLPIQQHATISTMLHSSSAVLSNGRPAHRLLVVSDHLSMFMGTNGGSSANTTNVATAFMERGAKVRHVQCDN